MKNNFLLAFTCLWLLVAVSIHNSRAAEQPWATKMQSLSGVIKDLIPILASDKKFSDPKNEKAILEAATQLSQMTHGLKAIPDLTNKINLPDQDPSIQLIAELFESETAQAVSALKQGHKDYARAQLKSVTTYCVACHTRNDNGPTFKDMNSEKLATGLAPIEKAELFIALREFDKANKILSDLSGSATLAKKYPRTWEKAIRMGLALTIRVKNNPDMAIENLNAAAANKYATQDISSAIPIWKQALLQWKHDNRKIFNNLQEAQYLIAAALKARKQHSEHAADVYFLRATSYLHNALKDNPKGPLASRALYLTGVSYEALNDFGLWSLHELYYEACINEAPHTSASLQCYQQLEKSVSFSYSGSSGVSIPAEITEHLKKLKEKAY